MQPSRAQRRTWGLLQAQRASSSGDWLHRKRHIRKGNIEGRWQVGTHFRNCMRPRYPSALPQSVSSARLCVAPRRTNCLPTFNRSNSLISKLPSNRANLPTQPPSRTITYPTIKFHRLSYNHQQDAMSTVTTQYLNRKIPYSTEATAISRKMFKQTII